MEIGVLVAPADVYSAGFCLAILYCCDTGHTLLSFRTESENPGQRIDSRIAFGKPVSSACGITNGIVCN